MSDWYYADDSRQRRGPLPADALAELFRSQRIAADTLVWRAGMAQWQPLSAVAGELGLSIAAPPPLPPSMPARPATPVSAPPKRGLSGCLIALIVVAVCAVPMVAILAAIALPAYQDYVIKAQVAEGLGLASGAKTAVAEFRSGNGECPRGNADAGLAAPTGIAGAYTATVEVGQLENGDCAVQVTYGGKSHANLQGRTVLLEYDLAEAAWRNGGGSVPDKYLPASLRQ
ncbi:MAG: pilin [Pseudoxanthomonas sp.]